MDGGREQALRVRVRRAAEVVEALQTVAEAGDGGVGGAGVSGLVAVEASRLAGREREVQGKVRRADAALARLVRVASKVAGVLRAGGDGDGGDPCLWKPGVLAPWLDAEAEASRRMQEAVERLMLDGGEGGAATPKEAEVEEAEVARVGALVWAAATAVGMEADASVENLREPETEEGRAEAAAFLRLQRAWAVTTREDIRAKGEMARREAAEAWGAQAGAWAAEVVAREVAEASRYAAPPAEVAREVAAQIRALTSKARERAARAREARRAARDRTEVVRAADRRAWRIMLAPLEAAMRGWEDGGAREVEAREAEACVRQLEESVVRRGVVGYLIARQGELVARAAEVWRGVAETLGGWTRARAARLARGCGDLDAPAECVVAQELGEAEVAEECEQMVEELGRMVRGEDTEGALALAGRLVRAREARERWAYKRLVAMGRPEELRRLQGLAKADVLRGLWINPDGSPERVDAALAFIREHAALPPSAWERTGAPP